MPATLPPPADTIVSEFADKICRVEPEFVEGIYLTGSISLNDFYSNKSDIDFLVLCKKFPDENIAWQLKNIHRTIHKSYPKPDLSGSYLAAESIRADKPENIKTLSWHEGTLCYGTFEMAPVSIAELKSNSITVFGTDAAFLPVEIQMDTLKNFLYRNINSYWKKWISQHSSIFGKKILLYLFPRFTEWSVLGVARQFCTLKIGKIVSKTDAGYYCLDHLPEKFHSVIKQAIEIRKNNRTYPIVKSYTIRPSFTRLAQTIECINYIIALFNRTYNEQR